MSARLCIPVIHAPCLTLIVARRIKPARFGIFPFARNPRRSLVFPSLLPTYNRTDVAFVRGEGPYLFAEGGERYLDFGGGIAVNALGHAHPKLVAALTEQAGRL